MFGRLGSASIRIDPAKIRQGKLSRIPVIFSDALGINGLRVFGGVFGGFDPMRPRDLIIDDR